MKERGIPFSAPMVRSILDGRKTKTRRLVKMTDRAAAALADAGAPVVGLGHARWEHRGQGWNAFCPYPPGVRLWVREAFHFERIFDDVPPRDVPSGSARVWYSADEPYVTDSTGRNVLGRRRPAMFMPRWASRITLEVTGVRVERLQDISEEDARAEGVVPYTTNTLRMVDPEAKGPLYRRSFEELWDELNAARAPWASNPHVWVIEFRRLDVAVGEGRPTFITSPRCRASTKSGTQCSKGATFENGCCGTHAGAALRAAATGGAR